MGYRVPGSGARRGEHLPYLRAWRLARGMTQAQVAVAADISLHSLRHMEMDAARASAVRVSVVMLNRLAHALRVPPARLLRESPYREDVGA